MGRKKVQKILLDNSDCLTLSDYIIEMDSIVELMIKYAADNDPESLLNCYYDVKEVIQEMREAERIIEVRDE